MGFQVIPCAMASPDKESTPQLHISPKDSSCRGEKQKGEGKKVVPRAENIDIHSHDILHGPLIDSPCTSSFSLRSNSANPFLSQCSSLASIPSLGLSYSNDISSNLHHLGVVTPTFGGITAQYTCLTTLHSYGDQVAGTGSPADKLVYTASSISSACPSLIACLKHGVADTAGSGEDLGSMYKGAVRSILVVGDHVFTAHDDMKLRVWARLGNSTKKETISCMRASQGGGPPEAKHRLVAALPTMWDCVKRSMAPGAYLQVRRHHKKLWIQHSDAISALAVDLKREYLYSASWDRSVKVWRLHDLRCVESFRAHDDAVKTLAFSTDGFLYTAAADGKIKVWARQTRAAKQKHRCHSLVATLEAHRSAVNALALSPDGALLYSGACDKAIVVWEREDSAQHASLAGALRGHRQAVLCLASLGATLCSGSADKSIRVWQRVTGRVHACVAVLQGHAAPVKSLILFPDEGGSSACLSLWSAAFDHDIKIWQLRLCFR